MGTRTRTAACTTAADGSPHRAGPYPERRRLAITFHGDGSLSKTPPTERESSTTYTFDPRDPVPTMGGAFSSTSPVFEPGAYHQEEREGIYGAKPPYLPLSARPDVVVFQTEPLAADVEVVGPNRSRAPRFTRPLSTPTSP